VNAELYPAPLTVIVSVCSVTAIPAVPSTLRACTLEPVLSMVAPDPALDTVVPSEPPLPPPIPPSRMSTIVPAVATLKVRVTSLLEVSQATEPGSTLVCVEPETIKALMDRLQVPKLCVDPATLQVVPLLIEAE